MDMQQQIEQVRTRIQRAIAHSYVDRYIQPRMIDEDRISFALSMLRSARVEENIALDYVFAMMLIQLALDTHDEVDEQQISQQKQLTVLAGDLYSGLYYDFLARRHDISLIRRFAEAIKEINIKKFTCSNCRQMILSVFIASLSLNLHCFGSLQNTCMPMSGGSSVLLICAKTCLSRENGVRNLDQLHRSLQAKITRSSPVSCT